MAPNSTPDPVLMQAVERLGYRATLGDFATQAGLDVNLAQRGLLALASEANGHLQVAESGEIIYAFPENFRAVLQNKYWRLRLQEQWSKVWRILFYLIRISFGIALLLSIALIALTLVVIMLALNSSRDSDNRNDSRGGGISWVPNIWFGPDLFWFFSPNYGTRHYRHADQQQLPAKTASEMNFLEAVFSFLFGDGNPNADLEERRWRIIGNVIRNNKGAVVAEQIAPYLESTGQGYTQEYEEYMLPVLSRFNGRPEVSPTGDIVYHFPELQTTVGSQRAKGLPAYLEEKLWQFSRASGGQITAAISLGSLNFIGAIVLWRFLSDGALAQQLGGLVAFSYSLIWVLLGYGIAFVTVPLVRYFWIQQRNRKLESRNRQRQARSLQLSRADAGLQQKLAYAQQFAAETVIHQSDLVYTTETDLLEQETSQSDRIDAEWQRRLNQSN